jgi:hypothetical protein
MNHGVTRLAFSRGLSIWTSFPLTPALSRREREARSRRGSKPTDPGLPDALAIGSLSLRERVRVRGKQASRDQRFPVHARET